MNASKWNVIEILHLLFPWQQVGDASPRNMLCLRGDAGVGVLWQSQWAHSFASPSSLHALDEAEEVPFLFLANYVLV